jgi:hypothetical protein
MEVQEAQGVRINFVISEKLNKKLVGVLVRRIGKDLRAGKTRPNISSLCREGLELLIEEEKKIEEEEKKGKERGRSLFQSTSTKSQTSGV